MGYGMGHPEGLGYHTREAPPNTTEASAHRLLGREVAS